MDSVPERSLDLSTRRLSDTLDSGWRESFWSVPGACLERAWSVPGACRPDGSGAGACPTGGRTRTSRTPPRPTPHRTACYYQRY